MLRELAENPNVHQPLQPGRELVRDPEGRFALFLGQGHTPHDATVQRVRVEPAGVIPLLADVRTILRSKKRAGAEWELGPSSTPADLVDRLLSAGLRRDPHEPVATGMVLAGAPGWEPPSAIEARRVESRDELAAAREVQHRAFGDSRPVDLDAVGSDYGREGIDGSTFVALVDGQVIAAAYASYTPWGSILFGGATLEEHRGAGAYRALVAARARDAENRGIPRLVVHAGHMSRPVLERLGFEAITRIDRLIDELPGTE